MKKAVQIMDANARLTDAVTQAINEALNNGLSSEHITTVLRQIADLLESIESE